MKLTREDLDQLRLEVQAMPPAVAELVQRVLDNRRRLREALRWARRNLNADAVALVPEAIRELDEALKEGEE